MVVLACGFVTWVSMFALVCGLGCGDGTDSVHVSVLEETVERIGLLELGLFSRGAG